VIFTLVYPGYAISGLGSLIGLVYGFIDGAVCGALFGWLYNLFSGGAADARKSCRAFSQGVFLPGHGVRSASAWTFAVISWNFFQPFLYFSIVPYTAALSSTQRRIFSGIRKYFVKFGIAGIKFAIYIKPG